VKERRLRRAKARDEVTYGVLGDTLLPCRDRLFVNDDENVATQRFRTDVGGKRRRERRNCGCRQSTVSAEQLKELDVPLTAADLERDLLRRQVENRLTVPADGGEVDHRLRLRRLLRRGRDRGSRERSRQEDERQRVRAPDQQPARC
jgi:hypothetical protein